ncbi:MAG: acetylglutamate kinase [Anaerolineae bacterium]|nr:acetylglutamate kinase [Anaerolineae bacterium]
MSETVVLKIGGNEIDDDAFLGGLARAVAVLRTRATPVVVHGGGKEIARLQQAMGLQPRFVDGLRVTDEQTLTITEMVLSGAVNKRLVARFLAHGVPAVGLSGVDGGLLRVKRLEHPSGDLGRVGEVTAVDPTLLRLLMAQGIVPVVSPVSLGPEGRSYNVNADQAAAALARALGADSLAFVTNVPGVLADGRVVDRLLASEAEAWIGQGVISGGMVPKVRAALEVVASGVPEVTILDLEGLQSGGGTRVVAGSPTAGRP